VTDLQITFDNPAGVPAPAGSYSHVARLELGDSAVLLVSGQLALADDGRLIGEGSMTQQSERVFEVLGANLSAHGASFADVVHIRTHLTDLTRIGDYGAVRRRHLADARPASTTVEVSGLAIPGAVVEVELMAAFANGS